MGMETWIRVRTKFTNGYVLEKDIIHMCKYWKVRERLLETLNIRESKGGSYGLKYKSNLSDIKDMFYDLITKTSTDNLDEYTRGDIVGFFGMIGYCIGELEAAYRYVDRDIPYYRYYEDELENSTCDMSGLCVDKIEAFFEDSP